MAKQQPASQVDRVRAICLALPEAAEKISWGRPTFVVGKRMFAAYMEDHHGDGRIALWCAAPRGAQQVLCDSEPRRYFVPPYVGVRGWIGVLLEANDDERVEGVVRDAYLVVAPKRLRVRLET